MKESEQPLVLDWPMNSGAHVFGWRLSSAAGLGGLRWLVVTLALSAAWLVAAPSSPTIRFEETGPSAVTHGPMLGNVTSTSIRVWARTRNAGSFIVRHAENAELTAWHSSAAAITSPAHDYTAWVDLRDLKPATKYYYAIDVDGRLADTRVDGQFNSFRTLPAAETFREPKLNPAGLFNFSFEIGSCNHQGTERPPDAVYATMLRQLKDRVHFHVLNGDWIYEAGRDVTAARWAEVNPVGSIPAVVDLAQGITGVWQNYKLYLERGRHMAIFHREMPLFVMFDDHEIYNDINGTGQIGMRADSRDPEFRSYPAGVIPRRAGWRPLEREVERAVFRDPALRAWEDYLGWANPDAGLRPPIHFGRARLAAGSDVLLDPAADFSALDLAKRGSLHVHWGQGNSGVYEVAAVLDRNRLRLRPAPAVTEEARYSIGTQHYTRFRVGNCDFFLLDTRSFLTLQSPRNPHDPETTILGRRQYAWLVDEMRRSDATFFFLVSSVSFTIPHDNGALKAGGTKNESWTAYAAERDRLIDFFKELGRPVFIFTGDIHNSFAVKISPTIWEFLSGPHMSPNHYISEMADVPLTGPYSSQGRMVTMRWGTGLLGDVPKRPQPNYCVVQVNNVFNSPGRDGKPRWVSYHVPQVVVQFYDGLTGELKYAESVSAR